MRRSKQVGSARFRRLRAIARKPSMRSMFNRFRARRFAKKVARRTRVTYISKAPRYPGAIWLGQTQNTSGPFSSGQPFAIVQHYTAAGSGLNSAKYLFGKHSPASSAHFIVDRDGVVYQICGIDLKAWHAGKSTWTGTDGKTYDGLNTYSIGIEFANYGWDVKKVSPANQTKLKHKREKVARNWEVYPEAQIKSGLALTEWIARQIPSIKETMGHDDISPGRKSDPGPAFPMERFKMCLRLVRNPAPTAPAPAPETTPPPADMPVGFMGSATAQPIQKFSGENSMTKSYGHEDDNEDLSGGEAAQMASMDGDEPIDPPMFNQAQTQSFIRTLIQSVAGGFIAKGVLTAETADTYLPMVEIIVGGLAWAVVTWWSIRTRSTKNLIRDAQHAKRVMVNDAKTQL
jgi:N-acetylmuramoyl-L-alanine amidase